MRRFAFRIGVSGSLALGVAASCLLIGGRTSTGLAESHPTTGSFRILYTSDWSGSSEIYAADPSGGRPTVQLTFGRAPTCVAAACGYGGVVPSPDGRFVLYSDWASCDSSHASALFVARADGTHRRVVTSSGSRSTCPGELGGAWAPDSKRLAYSAAGRVHTVDIDGGHDRVVGRGDGASWSPDGRSIAVLTVDSFGGYGTLSAFSDGRRRVLASGVSDFAWSPNGRWIAYGFRRTAGAPSDLDVARANGTGRRSLLTASYIGPGDLKWSADSRFLSDGNDVVNIRSRAIRALGAVLAWQPQGHVLAAVRSGGIYSVDAATGPARRLTSDQAVLGRWSPDGRTLAYITHTYLGDYERHDLRVLTVTGQSRTLIDGAGAYGGDLSELAWTRIPKGVHYQRPQPRALAAVRDDGLTARWAITRLAADGNRVAYAGCGHVFVWTPAARTVVQAEPTSSLSPRCPTYGDYVPFWLYTLSLSGDRVAFGDLAGNMGQTWGLYAGRIAEGRNFVSLGRVGSANGCAVGQGGLGDLVGAGGLLAFSTWRDGSLGAPCPAVTLEQEIHRVDGRGCPCPVIATSQGPLVPFDVDAGRIVAGGENATVVLDGAGATLVSVPVSPLAAQLSGSDLAVLVRGQLLVYDVATGTRLHAWTLPDVPSGGECASPHSGTWECGAAQLVLEDVAHGLAAFVLDGKVHILRLADGVDATVAAGTLARFTDTGLVYADGASLHLVPFERLPIR